MKSAIAAGALVLAASSVAYTSGARAQAEPMTKLSQAECGSLWSQASPSGNPITESEAAAYLTDFKAANPDGDTTIEKDEFSKACDNGLVKSTASSGASTGEFEL